jgi:hypothetical protein
VFACRDADLACVDSFASQREDDDDAIEQLLFQSGSQPFPKPLSRCSDGGTSGAFLKAWSAASVVSALASTASGPDPLLIMAQQRLLSNPDILLGSLTCIEQLDAYQDESVVAMLRALKPLCCSEMMVKGNDPMCTGDEDKLAGRLKKLCDALDKIHIPSSPSEKVASVALPLTELAVQLQSHLIQGTDALRGIVEAVCEVKGKEYNSMLAVAGKHINL